MALCKKSLPKAGLSQLDACGCGVWYRRGYPPDFWEVEAGWEAGGALKLRGCRNDLEKVDCRGTMLAWKMDLRMGRIRRDKRHVKGSNPGNLAGCGARGGMYLLLFFFGAGAGRHFSATHAARKEARKTGAACLFG